MNPFNPAKYPNVYDGHNYAEEVVSGIIPACIYVKGACRRYLKDVAEENHPTFYFEAERAEKFLRLAQRFEHISGEWKTKNVVFEPWQKFVGMNIMGFVDKRTGFRRFRFVHLEIPRGNGKQLPITSRVPTPDGFKLWKDVKVGSQLFGSDGQPCNVIAKSPIRVSEIYEVEFSDGSIVECCKDHLWLTKTKVDRERDTYQTQNPPKRKNKHGEMVSKETEFTRTTLEIKNSLKNRNETNHSVKLCKPIETNLFSDIPWYYVGYWLGNGTSLSSQLNCHEDDAEELRYRLTSMGLKCLPSGLKKDSRGIKFTVSGAQELLRELGILGNKTFKEEWLFLSVEDRLDLLRGLLDSDGTIDGHSRVEFYSGLEVLAEGVRKLASSLGYKATKLVKPISENNNFKATMTHYRVGFTPRGEEKVFKLSRKAEKQIASKGDHTYCNKRYIVDVRATGRPEKMFCVSVDSPDHTYLVGDSFIPTHNSPLASIFGLYFLALDNPKGNQISTVATKTDQARIVLDAARAMARKNKSFLRQTNTEVLAHKIVHEESNSVMRALSSDHNGMDGLNDILAILDELHAMDRSVFEVITSGMSKRSDSLTLCITTAGFELDSVGYAQSCYAKKVATGEHTDEQFFAIVYTIDKINDIYDDINDPLVWRKANPNFGVSVDPITFEAKVNKARVSPSDLNNLKVKHFNVWLSEARAYYSMEFWDKCADYDMKLEDFKGDVCKIAIDLASTRDLTCTGTLFKKNGIYCFFERTYIPEDRAKEVRSVQFDKSIERGELITTPGNAINNDRIKEDIIKASDDNPVDEAAYDPWNAKEMSMSLSDIGFNMVQFKMNTANFSEPMKKVETLIREGKFKHNGSSLLRWAIGNVVAKEDANGNVFPRKTHEDFKIDPAVTLIMALGLYLQEENKESAYEERGLLVI